MRTSLYSRHIYIISKLLVYCRGSCEMGACNPSLNSASNTDASLISFPTSASFENMTETSVACERPSANSDAGFRS